MTKITYFDALQAAIAEVWLYIIFLETGILF